MIGREKAVPRRPDSGTVTAAATRESVFFNIS